MALFQSTTTNPALLAIIFPLHSLAVFCMFYDLYFVSKSLSLAETSRPVSFYDYAGPILSHLVFPHRDLVYPTKSQSTVRRKKKNSNH